jgi:hypothetical protein
MSETEQAELSQLDLDALQLSVDLCLCGDPEGPGRAEQVRDMLNGYRGYPPQPWFEVAKFCSDCQQSARLNLLVPYKMPPCDILTREAAEEILAQGFIPACHDSSIDISSCQTAKLLIEMLSHGVSPFHPNPLRAIAEAKKAKGQ